MARKQQRPIDSGSSPDPLALASAAAELRYRQTSAEIDRLERDEAARTSRIDRLLLQYELQEAKQQFQNECDRRELLSSNAQKEAGKLRAEVASSRAALTEAQNALKVQTKQCESLRTELASMEALSADTNKTLAEKLALTRELASLKPELEDLRSRVDSQKNLLSEKLSLQRRLSNVQAELDDEKKNVERVKARQGKAQDRDAQHEEEVEALRSELEQVRKQYGDEKKSARKEYLKDIAEFRKELEAVEEERVRLERAAALGARSQPNLEEVKELQDELSRERKERQKLEKQLSRNNHDSEAQAAVLEDKLSQFRTKLKSTKEKLRETEAELLEVRSLGSSSQSVVPARQRNSKKRTASQIDPEAIGTPGDGIAAKRAKRASSVVGEKSTFSITPFLNRQSSVSVCQDRDEPVESIEDASGDASPSANRELPSSPAVKQTLAPVSASKLNSGPAAKPLIAQTKPRKKTATASSLARVAEEDPGEDEENVEPQATSSADQQWKPARQLKSINLKPKSLSSFASFREASLAPDKGQKKARKLGGGRGPKTLFDEDEDDDSAPKAKLGTTRRAFGALNASSLSTFSAWGSKKAPLAMASDGFVFSPLKKDRKAAATAAVG